MLFLFRATILLEQKKNWIEYGASYEFSAGLKENYKFGVSVGFVDFSVYILIFVG